MKRKKNTTLTTVLLLILVFPLGLIRMWKVRCRWPFWVKTLVTLLFAALAVLIVLPLTTPPSYKTGGVDLVYAQPEEEAEGPEQSEDADGFRPYVPIYVPDESLIVSPTPTPLPIYVYCNDGGKSYHTANCRYVKKTTPRVTLSQAVNAGYTQCGLCDCPNEKGVYRDGRKGYRMPDEPEPTPAPAAEEPGEVAY